MGIEQKYRNILTGINSKLDLINKHYELNYFKSMLPQNIIQTAKKMLFLNLSQMDLTLT